MHLVQSLFSNLLPVVRVICLLPLNLWLSEMHLVPLIDNRVKMLAVFENTSTWIQQPLLILYFTFVSVKAALNVYLLSCVFSDILVFISNYLSMYIQYKC